MHGRRIRWLAALLAATLSACGGDARPAPSGAGAWRRDPLWDDGRAEYCVYEVTWARYGAMFPGRALLVTVKEPWAPDLDVKADRPRDDGFDVLKLNHIRDVPTGIYTYHQMASVYLRRDTGAVRKLAATSSEACGISTADVTRGVLRTRSYFDGQGDRKQPWLADALPEDGLPVHLRDFVQSPPPAAIRVFPSLLMGRFADLEPRTMQVRRTALASLAVPAGTFAAVEIQLAGGGRTLTYAFEAASPHRLLRYAAGDGTEYRLAKSERLAYWEHHAPGDEAWLPDALR